MMSALRDNFLEYTYMCPTFQCLLIQHSPFEGIFLHSALKFYALHVKAKIVVHRLVQVEFEQA